MAKRNYKELNDYELLYLIYQSDDLAFNELSCKYEAYIIYLVDSIYRTDPCGVSKEDCIQECKLRFYEAVKSFRDDQGCSFLTYLTVCVKRKMMGFQRYKHQYVQRAVGMMSLDMMIGEDEQSYLVDNIRCKDKMLEPEYRTRYNDSVRKVNSFIMDLSEQDQKIWQMMNADLSYQQAADLIGISKKTYDNRCQSIKRRIIRSIYQE